MADTAAHLVDDVLPRAPVRQWVLSFPHRIRWLLAYDPRLCAAVRRIFVRVVLDWPWARAAQPREACGLLLGRREASRIVVVRVVAARNVAAELERFEVDPRDQLEAQRSARESGLEVVGAWHSHAHGPATPSASDAREAVRSWVQVIVDARAGDCRAWYAGEGGLVELARVDIARREQRGAACRDRRGDHAPPGGSDFLPILVKTPRAPMTKAMPAP